VAPTGETTDKVHDYIDANLGEDRIHDASNASHMENITDTTEPSSAAGATGETISYQMCNYGIRVCQNCSRLTMESGTDTLNAPEVLATTSTTSTETLVPPTGETKFIVHSVTIYVFKYII
jgi:hypothetical protein